MRKFKRGDKIKTIQDSIHHMYGIGTILTIKKIYSVQANSRELYEVVEGINIIAVNDAILVTKKHKLYKRILL